VFLTSELRVRWRDNLSSPPAAEIQKVGILIPQSNYVLSMFSQAILSVNILSVVFLLVVVFITKTYH